ncbi:MAG: hypothetical protein IAF58_17870 [Leptolyngbya sp.]|nr:hypothetical protein [Candidatus Melainabacteria bacterium]
MGNPLSDKQSDQQDIPKSAKLETTLFDLANDALISRQKGIGNLPQGDATYRELNRIMPLNGYSKANLDGRQNISDRDLPKSWNNVKQNQEFLLYAPKSSEPVLDLRAGSAELSTLKERLKTQIIAETSTLPILPGEGYYQVLERMHPLWKPEVLVEEAHRIKAINDQREILRAGEKLATENEQYRQRELERRLKEVNGGPEKLPESSQSTKANQSSPEVKPVVPILVTPPSGVTPRSLPTVTETSGISLSDAYKQLLLQHQEISSQFIRERESQGIVGKTFDAAKNNIGTSAAGRNWFDPAQVWSHVFDRDAGSESVQNALARQAEQLEDLKKSADKGDDLRFSAIYRELTGKPFDTGDKTVAPLFSSKLVLGYETSQRSGVDTTTDIGAGLVALASLRLGKGNLASSMLRATTNGAVLGGTSKAGLMQIDGKYADFRRDFAVGAVLGATVPVGELAGAQMSRVIGGKFGLTVTGDLLTARLETQGVGLSRRFLSASLKSGTSGGVFGAIESPGREAIEKLEKGEKIDPLDLAGLSVKGAVIGFFGGTFLGGLSDGVLDGFRTVRPGKVVSHSQVLGGVEIPASGVISLDEAAKILKTEPAAFLTKAGANPYAAVDDAIELYNKYGLNIGKTGGVGGATNLPEQFAKALNTVQHVDVLTSEVGMELTQKVKIVRSADQYLQANPDSVSNPFQRVTQENSYREAVRITEQEKGSQAARAFEQKFQSGFENELKTTMSVERIRNSNLTVEQSLATAQPKAEAAYKQKAADFFKDITDPAQRTRLNSLVDDIYTKFNPESFSRQQLESIIERVPAGDRDLTVALLNESAGVSSDSVLKARMQSVRTEIQAALGTSSPSDVYTLAPNSSGNLLGYMYRKANSTSMSMHNLDHLAARVKNGDIPDKIVLFDDISSTSLSALDKALLKKIPNVYVVDVGAFEKSINVIDVSKGVASMEAKLDQLLAHARAVRAKEPNLLPTGVAQKVLAGAVDESATAIGANVHVLRPSLNIRIPNAHTAAELNSMSNVDAIYSQFHTAKASKAEIAAFLEGYAGEERELAAKMLAEGAVNQSFPAMVKKAVALHTQLQSTLEKSGLRMADLVLVSDQDPGGSTHLVSYLFGKVNNLAPENSISSRALDKLIQSGLAKNKAVAYFDDTIYSGSQTTSMLNSNVSSLQPFKRVVVASLGAYQKGLNNIKGTHLAQIGKVDVAAADMHHPFYSNEHPFFSSLPSSSQNKVKSIGGSEGFGSIQGSLIWPYMYPDNNLTFFGSQFSGGVLHLAGP